MNFFPDCQLSLQKVQENISYLQTTNNWISFYHTIHQCCQILIQIEQVTRTRRNVFGKQLPSVAIMHICSYLPSSRSAWQVCKSWQSAIFAPLAAHIIPFRIPPALVTQWILGFPPQTLTLCNEKFYIPCLRQNNYQVWSTNGSFRFEVAISRKNTKITKIAVNVAFVCFLFMNPITGLEDYLQHSMEIMTHENECVRKRNLNEICYDMVMNDHAIYTVSEKYFTKYSFRGQMIGRWDLPSGGFNVRRLTWSNSEIFIGELNSKEARIRVFSEEGKQLREWTIDTGQISDLVVIRSCLYVLVAGRLCPKICVFNRSGTFVGSLLLEPEVHEVRAMVGSDTDPHFYLVRHNSSILSVFKTF